MNLLRKRSLILAGLAGLLLACTSCHQENNGMKLNAGLIGAYYGDEGFRNIKYPEILYSFDNSWDEHTGHGSAWSGRYEGYLQSPVTADVTFILFSNKDASLTIDGKEIAVGDVKEEASLNMALKKGKSYHVEMAYSHWRGEAGILSLSWSWNGQEESIVPAELMGFSDEQARSWNYLPEADPSSIDYTQFIRANGKHVTVFAETGRFGGWPANGGIWNWDDEILVAFSNAAYKENLLHHSIDESKPSLAALARSLDGGESWNYEYPENYPGDGRELLPPGEWVDFSHPDLVIRVTGPVYAVSYDRGHSFEGPYYFPDFGREKLTSRTDYIPLGKDSCLFFLSTEEEDMVEARLQDWAFCALATDGGQHFEFLSWINEPVQARSVMPSSVQTAEGKLVSTLRRRYDRSFGDSLPRLSETWIDAFSSENGGRDWNFIARVADTDMGKHNGNPPSLCLMNDGRMVVTYGYRAVPYGIRAKLSEDGGHTWGEEIHLRDGAREFDLGYTRTVQRADGKLITVYYFNTPEIKEQFIEACIWDPDDLILPGAE